MDCWDSRHELFESLFPAIWKRIQDSCAHPPVELKRFIHSKSEQDRSELLSACKPARDSLRLQSRILGHADNFQLSCSKRLGRRSLGLHSHLKDNSDEFAHRGICECN